jgi:predicted secreted acid phosphatase
MNKNKILQQLELLFQNEILTSIPQVKNNQIQIKGWQIQYRDNLYHITDQKSKRIYAKTYTKAAALAFVKAKLSKSKNELLILDLDKTIEKNSNDCVFYRNTISKVKNKSKRFSTITRLEIADQLLESAKQDLHGLILH